MAKCLLHITSISRKIGFQKIKFMKRIIKLENGYNLIFYWVKSDNQRFRCRFGEIDPFNFGFWKVSIYITDLPF